MICWFFGSLGYGDDFLLLCSRSPRTGTVVRAVTQFKRALLNALNPGVCLWHESPGPDCFP